MITSIEGTLARAEIGGVERTISVVLTPEARVGDYVLMHTGFAISVLDPEEAQETLRLLAELAEFYPDDVPEYEHGDEEREDRTGTVGSTDA
jgi:hydrogenase expression/formation protein HypC